MERITLKQFDEEYFASCLVDKHSFSVDYLDDTRIGLSWVLVSIIILKDCC